MYRSEWELTCYVRQHVANLAREYPASRSARPIPPVSLLWRLARQRLGIGLIHLGHTLAGAEVLGPVPTSPGLGASS